MADALAIGELVWAEECAAQVVKATRKTGGAPHVAALRRLAAIVSDSGGGDDEDREETSRAARAWREVAKHDEATAEDLEALAWAELLNNSAGKAKAALARAAVKSALAEAAVAWVARRQDEKRLAAFVAAAEKASNDGLERAVRLLNQAHACPVALADRLAEKRAAGAPAWDPALARAVNLRVIAYRLADQPARGEEILAAWTRACEQALPDADDPRLHVLDTGPGGDELGRKQRRVARAAARWGDTSLALRMPLADLADVAQRKGEYDLAIEAWTRLDVIEATRRSNDRAYWLDKRRELLTHMGRHAEALAVRELQIAVTRRKR